MPNALLKSSSLYRVPRVGVIFEEVGFDPIQNRSALLDRFNEERTANDDIKNLALASQRKIRDVYSGKTSSYNVCETILLAANLVRADNNLAPVSADEEIEANEFYITRLRSQLQHAQRDTGEVLTLAPAINEIHKVCYDGGHRWSRAAVKAVIDKNRTTKGNCEIIMNAALSLFPKLDVEVTNRFAPKKKKKAKVKLANPTLFDVD